MTEDALRGLSEVRVLIPLPLGGRWTVTGGKASPGHQARGFCQPFHRVLPTKPVALLRDLKIAPPLRFGKEGNRGGPLSTPVPASSEHSPRALRSPFLPYWLKHGDVTVTVPGHLDTVLNCRKHTLIKASV